MRISVYLAGQIHDHWREEFRRLAEQKKLPVDFVGPMENHARSDDIGEEIMGPQSNNVLKDATASQVNNLRTRIFMEKADVVVALFGSKYRQWNVAMDAGMAIAYQKPLILIREEGLHHALKEIADQAQVVVETPEQALQALAYIFEKE